MNLEQVLAASRDGFEQRGLDRIRRSACQPSFLTNLGDHE